MTTPNLVPPCFNCTCQLNNPTDSLSLQDKLLSVYIQKHKYVYFCDTCFDKQVDAYIGRDNYFKEIYQKISHVCQTILEEKYVITENFSQGINLNILHHDYTNLVGDSEYDKLFDDITRDLFDIILCITIFRKFKSKLSLKHILETDSYQEIIIKSPYGFTSIMGIQRLNIPIEPSKINEDVIRTSITYIKNYLQLPHFTIESIPISRMQNIINKLSRYYIQFPKFARSSYNIKHQLENVIDDKRLLETHEKDENLDGYVSNAEVIVAVILLNLPYTTARLDPNMFVDITLNPNIQL